MASRIEQGFQRQLQHLPDSTRRLLLAAAVEPLGDITLLWRAVPHLGIDLAAAAPAEDSRLITFGGRVTFRHPLVRSAIYRSARVTDVRAVHAALAAATDAERDPERRAWHRAHAVVGPDEEVAVELERAAKGAAGRGALVTARGLLERAMELTPDPMRRGGRALDASIMGMWTAEFHSVLRTLDAAEMGPLNPSQRAWVAMLRAGVVAGLTLAPATPLYLEAASLFHALDAATAREAYLLALGTQMMAGRLAGASRLREVAQAARASPPAPEPPRPIDVILDGMAVRLSDGFEAGLDAARRAVAACLDEERPTHAFLLWLRWAPPLAPDVWDDDHWDRVTEHVVRLNRDAGAFASLPIALEFRAEFELYAGNLDARRSSSPKPPPSPNCSDGPRLSTRLPRSQHGVAATRPTLST
jgi:hypothetical protein